MADSTPTSRLAEYRRALEAGGLTTQQQQQVVTELSAVYAQRRALAQAIGALTQQLKKAEQHLQALRKVE